MGLCYLHDIAELLRGPRGLISRGLLRQRGPRISLTLA